MGEKMKIEVDIRVRSGRSEILSAVNSPEINWDTDDDDGLLEEVIESNIIGEILDTLGAIIAVISIACKNNLSIDDVARNSGMPIVKMRDNNNMN